MGSVYFVQVAEAGPVKIGYTKQPNVRLSTLQTYSPEKLVILAVVEGDIGNEKALHGALAQHRMNGEWFEPCLLLFSLLEDARAGGFPAQERQAAKTSIRNGADMGIEGGSKLKTWRREKNLTQTELADAIGASQAAVSDWERGVAVPEPPMMRAIHALTEGNVAPNDFVLTDA